MIVVFVFFQAVLVYCVCVYIYLYIHIALVKGIIYTHSKESSLGNDVGLHPLLTPVHD